MRYAFGSHKCVLEFFKHCLNTYHVLTTTAHMHTHTFMHSGVHMNAHNTGDIKKNESISVLVLEEGHTCKLKNPVLFASNPSPSVCLSNLSSIVTSSGMPSFYTHCNQARLLVTLAEHALYFSGA